MPLDEYLRDLLIQASRQYPDAAFYLVAVGNQGPDGKEDVIVVTNLDEDDAEALLDGLPIDGMEPMDMGHAPRRLM